MGWFGVGVRFDNYFGVYSCSWTTFIFYVSLNSGIWFLLNIGFIFYFFGPNRLFFGVGVEFENCFVVYSCSRQFWYWFLLNFWVIFYFLGSLWAIFGVGVEFENCFVVYSCSCSTFILYVSVNSGIGFCLIFGSFFTFWGPYGLFLGLG